MTTPDEPPAHTYNPGHPFWRDADDGAQPATPESQRTWRELLGNGEPLVVRRWLPGEDIDPAEIPMRVDREAFRQERQSRFVAPDTYDRADQPILGAAWEPYVGPHPEEAELYAQMRERQAAHLPAITREELERQGLLPPRITAESMINDDVRRALMGGASMETVQARLNELGFEYIGDVGPEGIQRTPLPGPRYDTSGPPEPVDPEGWYDAARQIAQRDELRRQQAIGPRLNTEEIARIYDVPLEMMANPLIPDPPEETANPTMGNRAARRGRPGRCQCGNATDPNVNHSRDRCWGETAAERTARITGQDPVPPDEEIAAMQNAIEQMRVLARNMERHTVDVEFTNETPRTPEGDPLTAIRTRPLGGANGAAGAGGGGGGYARQSTTWAAAGGGAAGAGGSGGGGTARASGFGMAGGGGVGTGETLRERLMRHGVTEATPDLDEGVVEPLPAPTTPRYMEPGIALRAQKQMDETFAELDTKSRGELIDLIADMRKDWETLNDIHNRRANRSSWCTEYEERQERHNAQFRALKLIGRVHNGPTDEYEGRGL